jgi:hypothetical protein
VDRKRIVHIGLDFAGVIFRPFIASLQAIHTIPKPVDFIQFFG